MLKLFSILVTDAEVNALLKRYSEIDESENNTEGISYDDMLFMPEFIGSVFAPLVIAANVDSRSQQIYARQFVKICSILSQQLMPEEKKKCEFTWLLANSFEIVIFLVL